MSAAAERRSRTWLSRDDLPAAATILGDGVNGRLVGMTHNAVLFLSHGKNKTFKPKREALDEESHHSTNTQLTFDV